MSIHFQTPRKTLLSLAVLLAGASSAAHADSPSLWEALTEGKAGLDLRYRYERVDQDNFDRNAHASTLRTRLNYATGTWQGLGAFVEFDNVSVLGEQRYNDASLRPSAKTQYPVVADPKGTEVNQAFLSYAGLSDTLFKYGRQRIIYDNARFIGNVGWRQNEQTFDAFTVVNRSLSDTTLSYAYLDKVHRIFGKDSPRGEIDMKSHLLNASYSGFGLGTLTAYGYFLEDQDTPASSSATKGLRFTGGYQLAESSKLLYTLEWARQDDYQDSQGVNARYKFAELGLQYAGITGRAGYEVLGVKDSAFSTPLATAHAFNGWADVFLVTPANGLRDRHVKLGGSVYGVGLMAAYHDFKSDRGSIDYGSEVNLQASKAIGKVNLTAKYARYSADDFFVDTEKFWLMGQVAF